MILTNQIRNFYLLNNVVKNIRISTCLCQHYYKNYSLPIRWNSNDERTQDKQVNIKNDNLNSSINIKKVKFKPLGITNLDDELTNPQVAYLKDDIKWIMIYRFPYITLAAVICRLKFYQTIIASLYFPLSGLGCLLGYLPFDTFTFYSMTCTFALLMLYIMGNLFSKLIGIMYISEDGSKIRLAHLTFYGNRQDEVYQTDDIVPLTIANTNINDLYLKVDRFSCDDQHHYLTIKFNGIKDKQKFQKVFGEIKL